MLRDNYCLRVNLPIEARRRAQRLHVYVGLPSIYPITVLLFGSVGVCHGHTRRERVYWHFEMMAALVTKSTLDIIIVFLVYI